MTVAYTVCCEIDDPAVATRWTAWITGAHMADVRRAGAATAELVRLDGPPSPVRFEVRYRFASRQAFEAYERDHAPRLRAEGLALFPLAAGLRYTRTVGEILGSG